MLDYLQYLMHREDNIWWAIRLYKTRKGLAYKVVKLKVENSLIDVIYDKAMTEAPASEDCLRKDDFIEMDERQLETFLQEPNEAIWEEVQEHVIPKDVSDYITEEIDQLSIYRWHFTNGGNSHVYVSEPYFYGYSYITVLSYKEQDKAVRHFKGYKIDDKRHYALRLICNMILPKAELISPKTLLSLKIISHAHREEDDLIYCTAEPLNKGSYIRQKSPLLIENIRYSLWLDFNNYVYEEYFSDGKRSRTIKGDFVEPDYDKKLRRSLMVFLRKKVWPEPWSQVVEAPLLKEDESAFIYVKNREKAAKILESFEHKTYREDVRLLSAAHVEADAEPIQDMWPSSSERCMLTVIGMCYDGTYFVSRLPYDGQYLPKKWHEFLQELKSVRLEASDFTAIAPLYNGAYYNPPIPKGHYVYLQVYVKKAHSAHFYMTDEKGINVGDEVKVPFGYDDVVTTGIVEDKIICKEEDVPYPLKKTKKVVSWTAK